LLVLTISASCGDLSALRSPKDVSENPEFRWVFENCIELTQPAYLVRDRRGSRLSLKEGLAWTNGSPLYQFEEKAPWPAAKGKTYRGVEVLDLVPTGARFRPKQLIEVYGAATRIVEVVVSPEGHDDEQMLLGDFAVPGFPHRKREPMGAKLIPCTIASDE
jgi:hypothetical protein